jgi:hypothetical protein
VRLNPPGPALLVVVLAAASLGGAARANPSLNPQGALTDGRVAYERGDYEVAIRTLRPLLYPSIELGTEEAVVEAHRLLTLSYFLAKKESLAEEEATSLLAMRPNFELDPVVDPPTVVRFFQEVRKKQGERLQAIRARQREEGARARKEEERRRLEAHAKAERVFVERTVERHSRLVALIPFGVGQAQNGQRKKAIAFLATELLLGALSLSAYLAIDQRYQTFDPSTNRRTFPVGDTAIAQMLVGLELGAGIAFWGVLAWGIVDAQVLYKPEVVRLNELQSAPVRGKPKVSLAPVLSPGRYGLQLQGAF